MPSFDYFATFDESIAILRDVCEAGNRIIAVPGLFDEPKAPTFDHVNDELVSILRMSPGFYVSGPFTRYPVQFSLLKVGPNAGKYTVDLLSQGPVLQGMVARVNVVDGAPMLAWGDISYQDKYRNPDTDAWEPASKELKNAYRQIVAFIKTRAPSFQGHKHVFISPGALELIERGQARIDDPRIHLPAR